MVRWQPQKLKPRRAFTLLEMLVVIAIIAVLAALAATGTLRLIEAQNEANTRTGIQAVYPILQKHWAKVVDDAKKETPSDAVYTLAGGDTQRAQVIWVKMRLMEAFPVSYQEVNSFPLYPMYIPPGQQRNIATYQKRITGSPPNESSACLVLALSVNRGGVVLDEEKLGPFLKTTSDGARYIVDGWGNPIAFFRFATEYPNLLSTSGSQWLNPNKTGRGATFSDPLDPDGKLQKDVDWDPFTTLGPDGKSFADLVHPVASGVYIIPALVSSGQDGKLGLSATMGPDNQDSHDNIYSFFLKVGATGN